MPFCTFLMYWPVCFYKISLLLIKKNIADDEFCFRFRSNVCRSLLLFCAISSGKEARDSVTGSYILHVSLIVIAFLVFFSLLLFPIKLATFLIYLIMVVRSLRLYFLFCLAFFWVIWVKLRILWKTQLLLIKLSFLLFLVSLTIYLNQYASNKVYTILYI